MSQCLSNLYKVRCSFYPSNEIKLWNISGLCEEDIKNSRPILELVILRHQVRLAEARVTDLVFQ